MKTILKLMILAAPLGGFLVGLSTLDRRQSAEDLLLLEEALHRGAVACYAAEGFYPPNADYLCRNYGVVYDAQRYTVHYSLFASNLMPDITVTERTP